MLCGDHAALHGSCCKAYKLDKHWDTCMNLEDTSAHKVETCKYNELRRSLRRPVTGIIGPNSWRVCRQLPRLCFQLHSMGLCRGKHLPFLQHSQLGRYATPCSQRKSSGLMWRKWCFIVRLLCLLINKPIQTLARILRYGVKQHEASRQNSSDWQTDRIFIKELFFQYQKRVKSCWVEDLWMLLPYWYHLILNSSFKSRLVPGRWSWGEEVSLWPGGQRPYSWTGLWSNGHGRWKLSSQSRSMSWAFELVQLRTMTNAWPPIAKCLWRSLVRTGYWL